MAKASAGSSIMVGNHLALGGAERYNSAMSTTIATAGTNAAVRPEEPPRLRAVTELLGSVLDPAADLKPQELVFDAATRTMIDAVLADERAVVDGLLDELRAAQARFAVLSEPTPLQSEVLGRVRGLFALCFAAIERMLDPSVLTEVGHSTHAHRFLLALTETRALNGGQLAGRLETDASEISRTGRRLYMQGLVARSRAGRHTYWELTRRGRSVVDGIAARQDRLPAPFRNEMPAPRGRQVSGGRGSAASGSAEGEMEPPRRRLTSQFLAQELMDRWLREGRDEVESRLRVWGSFNEFSCGPLHWSPSLLPDPRKQSRNVLAAKLRQLGVGGVQEFWPASLPMWDAMAIADGPNSSQGLVLFEAKLRPDEFRQGQVRLTNPARVSVLRRSLLETKAYLHAGRGADWQRSYPDAANRLAFLYYLRERARVPTWVVHVLFVGDPHSQALPHDPPHSEEEWRTHLEHVRKTLRLAPEHALSPFVREEFLLARAILTTHSTMEARMPKGNDSDRYVVPNTDRGGWDIVKENHERASAHTRTKDDAIHRAREITHNLGGGEVRIANRDGRFADSDTQSGPRHHESPARDRK